MEAKYKVSFGKLWYYKSTEYSVNDAEICDIHID